mgnify:CR=1 FL=1
MRESRKFLVFGLCPEPDGERGVDSLVCGVRRVNGYRLRTRQGIAWLVGVRLNSALVVIVNERQKWFDSAGMVACIWG